MVQKNITLTGLKQYLKSVPKEDLIDDISLRATESDLVARNESAWALPLPSATASAKFANNNVNNKINVIKPLNTIGLLSVALPNKFGLMVTSAVTIVPIQTKNITGFRN